MPYRPANIQKVTTNPEVRHRNENKKPGTLTNQKKEQMNTPIHKRLMDETVRSSKIDRNRSITETRDQRSSSRSVLNSTASSKKSTISSSQPDAVPGPLIGNSNTGYGVVDKLIEPMVKDKVHNPSMEHVGQVHHATVDKFHDPVLKDKVRTPSMNHIGQKHNATIDKFSEPVLKEKVKTPAFEHIGVKHNAVTNKFMQPVLNDKVKTPAKEHVGQKHHATIDKLHQPQLTGSIKTGSVNRNDWGKTAPKGDFKWVCENGAWKKDYEIEMFDGTYGHI